MQDLIKENEEEAGVPTDVNVKGANGMTPLHLSAFVGREEIAELLIKAGADVNAKTDADGDGFAAQAVGETPLMGPLREGHTELADLLRKHGGKRGEELKAKEK